MYIYYHAPRVLSMKTPVIIKVTDIYINIDIGIYIDIYIYIDICIYIDI